MAGSVPFYRITAQEGTMRMRLIFKLEDDERNREIATNPNEGIRQDSKLSSYGIYSNSSTYFTIFLQAYSCIIGIVSLNYVEGVRCTLRNNAVSWTHHKHECNITLLEGPRLIFLRL